MVMACSAPHLILRFAQPRDSSKAVGLREDVSLLLHISKASYLYSNT